ncbi:carboxypeptidase regulatory-like domain-containing protein [Blastopirellula marina]|uniref:Carboxypeptidase regulatory-like domain-containing protein n=1 Tax=Blastopirellula marina TaxID=124 RepID=A0A2S8EYN6_9BACT|nr:MULTISPECIES: carboxypeptidase regulatory-like domain-containing protein [Pirellulaceae]PQO25036.1 carboxypeptidase regulatory-like domain-containing protein [Blastopirellula marina]RCS40888.1 carboxypeptidase regulatory-like domain-containing protein [Bremerella cremea]
MISRWITLTACVAVLGIVGCVGSDPNFATVEGNVTIDGQPAEGLEVTFEPESGRPAIGYTNAQGHYELQYTANQEGASLGKYRVRIDVPSGSETKARIPTRYNAKTELVAEVTPGQNELNFELTSKR